MSDTSSLETAVEFSDVPDWNPPKATEAALEWADILTVDLSLFETNRPELVNTVATALQRDGFFYVVGHQIEAEKVHIHVCPCYRVVFDHSSS
jgi:hypothetical protein